MQTSKVAKRYAQGLLDFSSEMQQTDATFAEMKDVVKILDTSKDLNSFFAMPFVDSKKKIEIAGQIFTNFSAPVKNFISLIIKHGRESHLKNIAQEYINKVEDIQGIQRVSITTATALSNEKLNEILKSVPLFDASRKFDLKTIINPELIGGYILRVGDSQVDASVRSKLNNLKKEFQLN